MIRLPLHLTPFRGAIAIFVAVSLLTLVGLELIYISVSTLIEERRQTVVSDDVAILVEAHQDRIRQDLQKWLDDGLLIYSVAGLFDRDGTYVAGNLKALPPGLPVDGKVHRIELPAGIYSSDTDTPANKAIVAATRMADGTIFVFGRTLTEIRALRLALIDFGLLAIATILLISLAYGLHAGARHAARLKLIQQTFARIMAGALDERLPVGQSKDDLNRFAADVNRLLDMLSELLTEAKGAGDNIAHDLRTPLALARTRIERALLSAGDEASLRATMSYCLADLDRASRTIAALLRLAEIENGQRRSSFRDLDLAQIARDAVDFYEPLAETRQISLVLNATSAVKLNGDVDLLLEALNNLLDNAIKFSQSGTAVTIDVFERDGSVTLSVSDQGVGIPPTERPNIGKRFHRLDKSRSEPGTGLGLSLVHAIARLHGFTVEIDSNHPHGTIITLVRPLAS